MDIESRKHILSQFEIETVEGQENVVLTYLAGQGMGNVAAETLVDQYKTEGTLAEKAKEMLEALPGIIEDFQAQVAKEQAEFKEKRDKILAGFRAELRIQLQSLLSPEDDIEKWISFVTDQTPGTNCEMDTKYFDYRNNPEKTAKLVLFFKENMQ